MHFIIARAPCLYNMHNVKQSPVDEWGANVLTCHFGAGANVGGGGGGGGNMSVPQHSYFNFHE